MGDDERKEEEAEASSQSAQSSIGIGDTLRGLFKDEKKKSSKGFQRKLSFPGKHFSLIV